MIGTRRRLAVGAVVSVLGLGVSSCGGDDSGSSAATPTTVAPSTGSSTGSSPGSSTDAGTEPSPPDETATTPAPVPAGIELVEATSAVTAPEGWTPAEALVDYASSADGPARYDALQLADRPSLSGSSDIDELAASFRSSLPEDARLERLPDLDLAGSPAYHFHWTVPGDPVVYDSVSTLRNGRSITLDFFLNRSTATEQPQLVDSVLGTFRWL